MSEEKPTIQMDSENAEQPTGDPGKPTIMAGQESGPAPPTVAEGPVFQPTSPPQRPTPPRPQPAAPGFAPPAPPPAAAAPGGETMIMEPEREPIPLAWLAIVEGAAGNVGYVHTLQRETVVGRSTGDLLLSGDAAVSSQHLKVRLETTEEEEQVFVLYDMASSNGTYVGDRETYQEEENRVYHHVLKDGDFILVGQTTLIFKRV